MSSIHVFVCDTGCGVLSNTLTQKYRGGNGTNLIQQIRDDCNGGEVGTDFKVKDGLLVKPTTGEQICDRE